MHSAPAVSYPVGRSLFQGGLIALIALCEALLMLAWARQADAVGVRHVAIMVLCLLLTGWSARQWQWVASGALVWDGLCWIQTASGESQVVVPLVVLDFQFALLLCLRAQTGPCYWAWPERRIAPARWLPFRRALFGHIPRTDILGMEPLADQNGSLRAMP